jgi:hypothetical protein
MMTAKHENPEDISDETKLTTHLKSGDAFWDDIIPIL